MATSSHHVDEVSFLHDTDLILKTEIRAFMGLQHLLTPDILKTHHLIKKVLQNEGENMDRKAFFEAPCHSTALWFVSRLYELRCRSEPTTDGSTLWLFIKTSILTALFHSKLKWTRRRSPLRPVSRCSSAPPFELLPKKQKPGTLRTVWMTFFRLTFSMHPLLGLIFCFLCKTSCAAGVK